MVRITAGVDHEAWCRTPVNKPLRPNSGFRRGTVPGDASTTGGVVHVRGEHSTSVPDDIHGEWEIREVYVAGG